MVDRYIVVFVPILFILFKSIVVITLEKYVWVGMDNIKTNQNNG